MDNTTIKSNLTSVEDATTPVASNATDVTTGVTNPAPVETPKADISVDDILGTPPVTAPGKEVSAPVEPPMVVQNEILVPENDVLVTSNQLPVTSDQRLVTSNQLPVTSDQRSVTSNPSPTANYQSPVTNYRPQVTGYQSPTTGNRPPVTNYQSPVAGPSYNRGFVNPRTFVPRQPYEIPDANLPTETVVGVLDVAPLGHGYLRPSLTPSNKDVYVSMSQIRRFNMRPGDMITGAARQPKENERYWGLLKVERVNEIDAEQNQTRPVFDELTPIFPDKQLKLEFDQTVLTTRMVDLFSPIGMGQRGLVVSPPKAGKTWLLKDISTAVAKNYPEIMLIGVLIGERPEEVTDLMMHIKEVTNGKGELYPSNFDEPATDQIHIAELALERAKRLIEQGKDVVMILDSITRLARAYNMAMPNSGRTLSGGFDPQALFPAKHFFGAARKIQDGGSLTIVGTCLVDTGSRMDDLIYEEFKGTGNMELHLDRKLAERRVFPAFDIQRSGTRQEEKLYDKDIYDRIVMMRRMADMLNNDERTEVFVERLKKSKTNREFLDAMTKASGK